ncbi:MAG: hypothetical protein IKD80_00915 [Selenomonadaceae bacterium]|nr:hypothetical protein [Selenomonadaceae bacterium]
MPEGVSVDGTTLEVDGTTYYTGNVKLTVTDNPDEKYLKGATYNADGS